MAETAGAAIPKSGPHAAVGRRVLAESGVESRGLSFRFAEEDVSAPTDWGFRDDDHVVVVHRAGRLRAMETVFDGGPTVTVLPRVGDVWLIPAGRRYEAQAHGGRVSFCEMRAPAALMPGREMPPAVGRSDPFLFAATERLASIVGRDDDVAGMLRESLAEAVRLHVADAYAEAPSVIEPRRPSLDEARKRQLDERLRATLEKRHSLRSMAAFAGMSVGDFLKAFGEAFGVSPRQHLIRLRLERARELLTVTRAPVTEIALSVGFSTPSHFATSFRLRYGVRPTDVRSGAK